MNKKSYDFVCQLIDDNDNEHGNTINQNKNAIIILWFRVGMLTVHKSQFTCAWNAAAKAIFLPQLLLLLLLHTKHNHMIYSHRIIAAGAWKHKFTYFFVATYLHLDRNFAMSISSLVTWITAVVVDIIHFSRLLVFFLLTSLCIRVRQASHTLSGCTLQCGLSAAALNVCSFFTFTFLLFFLSLSLFRSVCAFFPAWSIVFLRPSLSLPLPFSPPFRMVYPSLYTRLSQFAFQHFHVEIFVSIFLQFYICYHRCWLFLILHFIFGALFCSEISWEESNLSSLNKISVDGEWRAPEPGEAGNEEVDEGEERDRESERC